MSTDRRQFMKTASVFAIGLGVPAVGAKIASAAINTSQPVTSSNAIDIFKKASFVPHLNTTFRVASGSTATDLRLVSITDLRDELKNPRLVRGRENFSLVFQPTGNAPFLSDNVYHLQHPSLGTFPMFLVGIGMDNVRKYEAAVNRL